MAKEPKKKKPDAAEEVTREPAQEAAQAAQEPAAEAAAQPAEETAQPAPEQPEEDPRIAALTQERDALQEKYLRLAAEYDNFRKRSQKEREGLFTQAKSDALTAMLPVYDNVERALKQPCADEAYAEGVKLIMRQLEDTFQKLGVVEIEAQGVPFDPNRHNAVMHVDDEALGENVVAEVFQKGFMIGDRVVRFAMVKVAN